MIKSLVRAASINLYYLASYIYLYITTSLSPLVASDSFIKYNETFEATRSRLEPFIIWIEL
jgi:hypothetical protein